jgi:hypothetical protein
MQTVMLKDKKNKEAHEESARLACEAAAAAKTVASLTREQGFVDEYSRSLGEPLRVATRAVMVQMFWFGCTQSTVFLVNALVSISSSISTVSFFMSSPGVLVWRKAYRRSGVLSLPVLRRPHERHLRRVRRVECNPPILQISHVTVVPRLATYSLSLLTFPSRRVPRTISFGSLTRSQRLILNQVMERRSRVSLAKSSCERSISAIPPVQRFESCGASI